jgi:hypothetical protein
MRVQLFEKARNRHGANMKQSWRWFNEKKAYSQSYRQPPFLPKQGTYYFEGKTKGLAGFHYTPLPVLRSLADR